MGKKLPMPNAQCIIGSDSKSLNTRNCVCLAHYTDTCGWPVAIAFLYTEIY
ncbi:hypothetical protein [Nostoc sp.]|uniref:hypothetical protein n=1 Tax=Nostoc sp. TaxID=1180 RepID=UPI002FF7D52F